MQNNVHEPLDNHKTVKVPLANSRNFLGDQE